MVAASAIRTGRLSSGGFMGRAGLKTGGRCADRTLGTNVHVVRRMSNEKGKNARSAESARFLPSWLLHSLAHRVETVRGAFTTPEGSQPLALGRESSSAPGEVGRPNSDFGGVVATPPGSNGHQNPHRWYRFAQPPANGWDPSGVKTGERLLNLSRYELQFTICVVDSHEGWSCSVA